MTPEQIQELCAALALHGRNFRVIQTLRHAESQNIVESYVENATLNIKITKSLQDFEQFKKLVESNKDLIINKSMGIWCIIECLIMYDADIKFFEYVLKLGQNPNLRVSCSCTLMKVFVTYKKDSVALANLLLKYGLNVNMAVGEHKEHTYLHQAFKCPYGGYLDVVKWLLTNGAEWQLDVNGNLPIHIINNTAILEYLFDIFPRKYFEQHAQKTLSRPGIRPEIVSMWTTRFNDTAGEPDESEESSSEESSSEDSVSEDSVSEDSVSEDSSSEDSSNKYTQLMGMDVENVVVTPVKYASEYWGYTCGCCNMWYDEDNKTPMNSITYNPVSKWDVHYMCKEVCGGIPSNTDFEIDCDFEEEENQECDYCNNRSSYGSQSTCHYCDTELNHVHPVRHRFVEPETFEYLCQDCVEDPDILC
jgi:hypothetical protein